MDVTVLSPKRKHVEMAEHVMHLCKHPRISSTCDYPMGCGPNGQTDDIKFDGSKVLKDCLADVFLSVHENANRDNMKHLTCGSVTSVEIKKFSCKLELGKPEKSDSIPSLRSLEHKDLEEAVLNKERQKTSVHLDSVNESLQILAKTRNDYNLKLSKCLEASSNALQTFMLEGTDNGKINAFKSTTDVVGDLNDHATDVSKIAKKSDVHATCDIPTDLDKEQKLKDAAYHTFNELYVYWSNLCNLEHLCLEDCLNFQPSLCTSVKKYDKYIPRKIVAFRTYPHNCGPKALGIRAETYGTRTRLHSDAMARTKLQLDKANATGHHKQTSPYPLEKKVEILSGKVIRPIGSIGRPSGSAKRKFIEGQRDCGRTIICRGSSNSPSSPKLYKTAQNSQRKENKEIMARQKVKDTLRLFQALCRKFLQEEQSKCCARNKHHRRVDTEAFQLLKEKGLWLGEDRKWLGKVPGIHVGDEFHYRIELCLTGLHPPPMAGIAFKKINGINLATSIVSSGGYNNIFDSSNYLVYEGEGGHPGYQKHRKNNPGDQKLERGNLALANSIDAKSPVRVIHGFREQVSSDSGKVKCLATYVYDGLYMVEHYWSETGSKGFSVFKFKLRRMPNQEPLPQKEILMVKQKKITRIGLCIKDISEGKEAKPIGVVNTIDRQLPTAFIYCPAMKYPLWYKRSPQKGCNCIGRCSNPESCACAAKNGGEFPFNYDGAIVTVKPLVYECGPHCSCPPSCYNRVSQHGIKFQLEVFKTKSRGWGVRSLASIPSGSFVCEYTGEVLTEGAAQKRANDEYLFQIGHNYKEDLWEGLSTCMPELHNDSYDDMEDTGFTIDAARYGNISRFINHSCSPNLYAQNLLYDHDDKKVPHIMLFAVENIPPLTELCYHYNYTIGQVHDMDGNVKEKACYCGSPHCSGRLY